MSGRGPDEVRATLAQPALSPYFTPSHVLSLLSAPTGPRRLRTRRLTRLIW